MPLINNRYHQIVDKAQRILFVHSKDINWEANVWYLERFQFDAFRYDPTRPVKRISFLDILDKDNREYLKMYIKYQLGVTSYSVQNIWARVYITKAFLRFLDKEELKVEKLTAAEIDWYMQLLPEDMRLMYLHLWRLGLRINEVCSIKRESQKSMRRNFQEEKGPIKYGKMLCFTTMVVENGNV